MNKPTRVQIQEFWKGCGCEGNVLKYLSNISLTLDSMFRYAVPKVYDMKLRKLNRFEGEWQVAYVAQVRLAQQFWMPEVRDKDSILALFWALYPIVVKEKDR